MISLAVDSLFLKVLLHILGFLQRKLPDEDPRFPLPTDIFLQLIHLCVESYYFPFEDRFYSQTFGFTIGSPLPPVLADLCLYFETKLHPSISLCFLFD